MPLVYRVSIPAAAVIMRTAADRLNESETDMCGRTNTSSLHRFIDHAFVYLVSE